MVNFFKKHLWSLILIIAIVLIPQSLNIQSELNMRVLVTGLSLDKKEDKIEVTAQIVMPIQSTGATGSSSLQFVSAEGKNLTDAIEKITYQVGKTIGLSHLSFIILGEDFMKTEHMNSLLDFLLRDSRIPSSALLLGATGQAKDQLKKTEKLEIGSAIGLQKIFKYKENSMNGLTITVQDFVNNFFNKSETNMISGIEIEDDESSKAGSSGSDSGSGGGGGSSSSSESQSGGSSSSESQSGGSGGSGSDSSQGKKSRIKFDNKLFYFKSCEYVDSFKSEEELLGVFLANPKSKEGVVTVEDVNDDIFTNALVSVYLRDKRVKVKTKFENNKPLAEITVSTNRNEVREITNETETLKIYKSVETYLTDELIKKLTEKITNCINDVFKKAQENNADIFNLTNKFYKHNVNDYKNYIEKISNPNDFIQHIELSVNVHIEKRL